MKLFRTIAGAGFAGSSLRATSLLFAFLILIGLTLPASASPAQEPPSSAAPHGGEANLKLPALGQVDFMGINGRTLLLAGLGVSFVGLLFGLVIYKQLKKLPVHRSM